MSYGGTLGYESAQINDQLVNVAPGQAYSPLVFGAEYTGPGYWPRNGVYNTPPVTPSPATGGQPSNTMGSTAGDPNVAGFPHPTTGTTNSAGQHNFFHLTKSPLIWALLFLVAGILMLQHIHYR